MLILVGLSVLAILFFLFWGLCFFLTWQQGAWKHGLSLFGTAVLIAVITICLL